MSNIDKEIKNALSTITGGDKSPGGVGDKRIKPTGFKKTVGDILDSDVDEIGKQIKVDAKRKLLRAAGDILSGVIRLIFDAPPARGGASNVIRTTDNVSYTNYSNVTRSVASPAPRNKKYDFEDLIYVTYNDAYDLLKAMRDIQLRNGKISVTELYDILKDPSNLEATDALVGWTDLTNAYVGLESGHYRLFLPPVVKIN